MSNGCLSVAGHAYEVCFAYMVNCATGALLPYYKFGRSPNLARAFGFRNRFESRYFDQARQLFEQRLADWQHGGEADVSYSVHVVSVSSDLKTNTAHLVTLESWSVTINTPNGIFPAYTEPSSMHHITMKRIPGFLLHKWVVTNYT